MTDRIRWMALLLAFALSACGPAAAIPTPAPTTAPTAAATSTPQPTSAPTTAPSATPQPTSAPTIAPSATPQPTAIPTTAPTTAPTAAATAAPSATSAPATAAPVGEGSILFLRGGALWSHDVSGGGERKLVDGVRTFAARPDGGALALVRGAGAKAEIWTADRDGGNLRRLTNDGREEAWLAWSPDGAALLYASSSSAKPLAQTWIDWSAWCVRSEVRLLALADGSVTNFGPGCDPTFSPDGRRIAYVTPPSATVEGTQGPNSTNLLRLINRQGANGWRFASAEGAPDDAANAGLLVHAPAFSPDGAKIVYHRFLGYRALVDLSLSQVAGSFKGGGDPLHIGFGWQFPARFSPDMRYVAVTQHNYDDARGFGGYDSWMVSLVTMDGTRTIAMPSQSLQAVGGAELTVARGQAAVWSPNGAELAVQLPGGWKPDLPNTEPFGGDGPGEVWRWAPGGMPRQRLVTNVDFASPLAWMR